MSVSEFEPGANARAKRGAPAAEGAADGPRRLGTRIDPPHVIDRGEGAESNVAASSPDADSNPAPRPNRLLRQARQLAAYLRQRAFELDRREALANAALAQAENLDREARHWFSERQLELDQREARLVEREQALEAASLAQQAAEQDLAAQRAAVERASQRTARRTRRLDALERVLGRRRRETLEWRLALEELWAQVSGRVDSAALSSTLRAVRERLGEEYREMHAALARRELRLLRLQRELARQRLPRRRGRG